MSSPDTTPTLSERVADIARALMYLAAVANREDQRARLEAMGADLRAISSELEDREQDAIETWERSDG